MKNNPIVPETSTTLLRNVVDPQHERWTVLVARYEPMMRAYLHERFPTLEADEIVQTTFVELAKMLPRYVYAPDETGRFHNYLTGILRHKALRRVRELERETMLKESFAEERVAPPDDPEEEAYWQSLVEIALVSTALLSSVGCAKGTRPGSITSPSATPSAGGSPRWSGMIPGEGSRCTPMRC